MRHHSGSVIRMTLLVTSSFGIIGILLMLIASLLDPSNKIRLFLSELGMVFGPIGLVGVIYELVMRREFEHRLREMLPVDLSVSFVFSNQRGRIAEDLLQTAKREILLLGNCPLYPYVNKTLWLSSVLSSVKVVRILSLNGSSDFARAREMQAGIGAALLAESAMNNQTLVRVLSHNSSLRDIVQAAEYNLPPGEWVMIIDRQSLLGTWYPFGIESEEAPCIYIRDCGTSDTTRRILDHYIRSFEYVWSHNRTSLWQRPENLKEE